jgi:hypothetical protein
MYWANNGALRYGKGILKKKRYCCICMCIAEKLRRERKFQFLFVVNVKWYQFTNSGGRYDVKLSFDDQEVPSSNDLIDAIMPWKGPLSD